MDSLGLFPSPAHRRRAADARSHELVGPMVPYAPTDRLQPGVDWAHLQFAFDDWRSDSGPTSVDTAALVEWLHGLDHASTFVSPAIPHGDPFYRAVRACLDWARHADRYTNPDGRSPGEITLCWAGVTDTPPSDDRPLPYPAISWWWDV